MSAITLEQFQAAMQKLIVDHFAVVGQSVAQPVVTGTRMAEFEAANYDVANPSTVGHIDGIPVIADYNIGFVPRIQVSEAFAKIQSPELVCETNKWMREFFGLHRPIYRFGDHLVMHPDTIRQYMKAAGQLPPL